MSEERVRFIRNLQTLVPLHEHTNAIQLSQDGRVEIQTRLEAPTDEFGIPRPEIMVQRLLGEMTTKHYVWPGQFDEHHLATPKADFTIVRTAHEGDIGSAFRGLSCLKIELPRQMHNFSHALFELPGRPDMDVMRQAVYEVGQVRKLQMIMNDHLPEHPDYQTSQMISLCKDALKRSIDTMKEPEVGMMPPLDRIAAADLDELRIITSGILRVRRFSTRHLIHPAIRKPSQKSRSSAA